MHPSQILNVVIDERHDLAQLDDLTFLTHSATQQLQSQRHIFRDYILSSEVFCIQKPERTPPTLPPTTLHSLLSKPNKNN